jgi:hypothetical protein
MDDPYRVYQIPLVNKRSKTLFYKGMTFWVDRNDHMVGTFRIPSHHIRILDEREAERQTYSRKR